MKNANLWMRQSVKVFWQGVNWENRLMPSVVVHPETNGKPSVSPSFTFDLRMSVRDYLNAINWSGSPVVAAPVVVAPTIVDNKEDTVDTLDDFLDDITKFF